MVSEAESVRAQLRITCADATTLLTDYDEGALTLGDHVRLEAHLAGCVACGVYLDQLRVAVNAMGQLRTSNVNAEVMDRLVQKCLR